MASKSDLSRLTDEQLVAAYVENVQVAEGIEHVATYNRMMTRRFEIVAELRARGGGTLQPMRGLLVTRSARAHQCRDAFHDERPCGVRADSPAIGGTRRRDRQAGARVAVGGRALSGTRLSGIGGATARARTASAQAAMAMRQPAARRDEPGGHRTAPIRGIAGRMRWPFAGLDEAGDRLVAAAPAGRQADRGVAPGRHAARAARMVVAPRWRGADVLPRTDKLRRASWLTRRDGAAVGGIAGLLRRP